MLTKSHLSKLITSGKLGLLFLFIFISAINAQIKIGLSGGANFASYTLSNKAPDATLMHKLGFSIGVLTEYQFLGKMSARMLAKYIQRGGKNEIAAFGNTQNKIYFNYLDLSPSLIYTFFQNYISAKVYGGLSFGYLQNAKVVSNGNQSDIKDDFKSFSLSGDLGIEAEIPLMEKISLLINGLYSYGLTNISKNVGSLETRDISIDVGFLYKL